MTDLVYIVGIRSGWKDNELRYSLRSMQKYLKNIGKVFIIGHCPSFLQNVHHIEYKEVNDKVLNVIKKTQFAVSHTAISDKFLCVYDDHFLLSDFDADEFPYFSTGTLSEHIVRMKGNRQYQSLLLETQKQLKALGLPLMSYNIHAPFTIEKSKYNVPFGKTLLKSMYGNMNSVPFEASKDYKLFEKKFRYEYLDLLKEAKFFSISDKALGHGMEMLMSGLYPDKSKYEQ